MKFLIFFLSVYTGYFLQTKVSPCCVERSPAGGEEDEEHLPDDPPLPPVPDRLDHPGPVPPPAHPVNVLICVPDPPPAGHEHGDEDECERHDHVERDEGHHQVEGRHPHRLAGVAGEGERGAGEEGESYFVQRWMLLSLLLLPLTLLPLLLLLLLW